MIEKLKCTTILKTAIMQIARGFLPTFRSAWPALLALHVIDLVFSQYSNWLQASIMQKGDPSIGSLILLFLSTGAFQLLWSAAWLIALAPVFRGWIRYPQGLAPEHTPISLHLLVIEETRVFAKTLLWLPLLILPAFYQYIRLLFTPFVVVFDPSYQAGKVDALQKSRELTQKRFGLSFTSFVIAFGLPLLFETLAQGDSDFFWENPLHIGAVSIMTLFINVASSIFLFSVYQSLSTVQVDQRSLHADV